METGIWVRRTFDLEEVDEQGFYSIIYKHDDIFMLYLNGTPIADTGYTWNVGGVTVKIDRSLLRKGKNVLAAYCYNRLGGAYVDFGLYKSLLGEAEQKSCVVMPTSTYYTFQCGGVDLTLVFTAPMVMKNLDLFTTPINYISYQVKSNDGEKHEVQFYLQTSAEMTVRNSTQNPRTTLVTTDNLSLLRAGRSNQTEAYLATGTDIIDWGYYYMAADKSERKKLGLSKQEDILKQYVSQGTIEPYKISHTDLNGDYYAMVYLDSLGTVDAEGVHDFTMLGYDDVYSIEYFGTKRKAYWSHSNQVSLTKRFDDLYLNYDSIMTLCREQDNQIYEDAYASAGTKYAEICCAVYRQANAAHKLITDTKGNLMYMSKENTSGGFINTLDVTYPSQPLYLIYNPALAKAMLTPVFEYSALGKWKRDFANHDLGNYPKANGQTYGGDMPVEESGNVLILTAVIAKIDNDLEYVERYWDLLTKWTDYLVENGSDPVNQLCTDDFMGHSARNANLAVKAIMGVASYSELATMLGKDDVAEEYMQKAKTMAAYWLKNAYSTSSETHYLLNFGAAADTWSNKYNMVWDKVWGWNIFRLVRSRELAFYKKKMTQYGLPLDNRQNHCKNDWHMWTAAMTENSSQLATYINPMWKFINECPTRVPVTDCHFCSDASRSLFHARSVVGGYWMKVFVDKFLDGSILPTPILTPREETTSTPLGYFDLQGREVPASAARNGIFIRKDTDGKTQKVMIKE